MDLSHNSGSAYKWGSNFNSFSVWVSQFSRITVERLTHSMHHIISSARPIPTYINQLDFGRHGDAVTQKSLISSILSAGTFFGAILLYPAA